MAKLFISCDDYIFYHNGKYFFKNQEWYDFYQRYLKVFDSLRICNRVIEENEQKAGRILVNDQRIEICHVPEFHGPVQYAKNYFAVGRSVRNAIFGCDAAILRLPSTIAQRVSKFVLKSGMPYAVEVVFDANDGSRFSTSIIEKILWRIIDKKMKRICSSADGVSCVTKMHLQQRYFSTKPNRFVSNYSTLDLKQEFYSGKRIYPQKSVFTIAHVSNQISLNGRKAAAEVIRAIGLVKQKGWLVNVRFAGEDRDNSALKFKNYALKYGVADQIECVGYLSRPELSSFLDDADLFVVPTKAEGLPRIIIEAIAKGLPVITTPVSGNPELIQSKYLVDYYDVESLSDKIIELISSKDKYESASETNFENSKNYESSLLEKRRTEFYTKLKELVK